MKVAVVALASFLRLPETSALARHANPSIAAAAFVRPHRRGAGGARPQARSRRSERNPRGHDGHTRRSLRCGDGRSHLRNPLQTGWLSEPLRTGANACAHFAMQKVEGSSPFIRLEVL
jgi:hypothetical protein